MPVTSLATPLPSAPRQARAVVAIGPSRIARGPLAPAPSRAPAAHDATARVLLPVTLEGDADHLREQRRALLRSPIGVYVSHIDAHRDRMAVWFDLAREDLNFAIHTLLATLPDATLGGLRKRMSY